MSADDARLAQIRERLDAATPGPWHTDGPFWVDPPGKPMSEVTVETRAGVTGKDRVLVMPGTWETKDADAEFIAHAPADVEWLIGLVNTLTAEKEAAEAERDALAAKIARVETLAACVIAEGLNVSVGRYGAMFDVLAVLGIEAPSGEARPTVTGGPR